MKSLDREGRLGSSLPWVLRFSRQPAADNNDIEANPQGLSPSDSENGANWSITHCYFANMGGFYIRDDSMLSGRPSNHLVTAGHFIQHWEAIEIPRLAEEDLKDKGKTDHFTKAIAVIQIAQLVLSLIFRKAQRLAFSQLETLTLAFAVCGLLTYVCAWYKPQDVTRPIQVFLRDPEKRIPLDILQRRTFDSLWKVLINSEAKDSNQPLERVPNDNIPKTRAHETHYAIYILTALTAGFGAIHAVAWNFEFPTLIEQIIWRVATLVSTILPPIALLIIPLAQIVLPWGNSDDFRNTCLHLMREYSWHTPNNQSIRRGIQALQGACGSRGESRSDKHFRDILGDGTDVEGFLGDKLLKYAQEAEEIRQGLTADFIPKFARLVDILRGMSNSKREWDAARTNTYPQRSLFGKHFNDCVIYTTTIAYCLARLAIVGISFSSLRLMPESVYQTTWTDLIPSIQ